MTCNRKAVLIVIVSYLANCAFGGESPLWDKCGCRWDDWESWSECSKECNGHRYRSRSVWSYTNVDGCPFEFSTCATNDMGSDYSRCNTFCFNGGTSNSYSCSCIIGFYGRCCQQEINCGHPGEIENGNFDGVTFTFGSSITYLCNKNYILVDGTTIRTCQITHTWNGTKPRCAYYSSCDSSPCKNNATCTNIPDDYTCHCQSGWSGKICDNDIQPPLMSYCPSNKVMQVPDLQQHVEWNIPSFYDPHNFDVHVTSNYQQNKWMFPWGDHNISYFAIKPSNGLSVECLFSINIRPKPCPPLEVPLNAAVICNNWKIDFGQICTYVCDKRFTVPRGIKPNQLYVCGASGLWTPTTLIPNCSVLINKLQSTSEYEIGKSYTTCAGDKDMMRSYYINQLNESPFNYLCTQYKRECIEENVKITC